MTQSEPSLRALQQWIKSRIRPESPALDESSESPLNPQRGTPGTERLSVYAGGYLARTREALAEVYEAIHHVLGERAFTDMAHAYAARYPSHDYNLSCVGRYLPLFLPTSPFTQRLPFLPDLARLEWLVSEAFHACEQPPFDPTHLSLGSLKDWNAIQLVFQPSVGLVASMWPILDIWEARNHPRGTIDIDLVNRPQRVLVFRRDVQVRCELVDERQHLLLEGLLAGRSLGLVCGALASHARDESLPVAEWFARWTGRGLIIRCEHS